ncbi:1-acyl-sn-glycerol-3-phosphate acyltransferase [Ginsengibacter hankyongi]|uniref:1-acyl-sn-glycerol-3-phosphate acyltransferase n=1 Tax=Ginsengibacter hankyongi TaxID=2607284 RepID=UPI0019277A27|nr:1-acyl-sn-glycerol-3-phosphate acyltransferase [Ginsengibacter hankyongi]
MLYKILLFPARLFIRFICRKIIINNKSLLRREGPLLIAANHPNSFLDAIILASLFRNPVYSLARGDAFAGKIITRILTSFYMLPVYRVSEGVENLENNYTTFNACHHIFKNNGIVLIFSEGRCINEWHLRPLKKGTARLALAAWQQGVPLEVLPLGINYSSFRKFGKTMFINFGNIITKKQINPDFSDGLAINQFNEILKEQLQNLVFEIDKNDKEKVKKYFYIDQSLITRILLFIPSLIGFIFHAPLYFAIHLSIKNKANDHYDSIMTGLLFFIYPFYILLITLLAFFTMHHSIAFLLLILMPLSVLALLHFRRF